MPELVFVGTGEAFDPELPNTSLLYRGGATILMDCGYAVPHAFWRLYTDPDLLDAIYISHLHADHSFGLPALLLWMRELGRQRELSVIAGSGVSTWLERLLDLAYPGSYRREKCYPIEPVTLSPGAELELRGVRLTNAQSDHPVRNLSLRIDDGGQSTCYSGDGRPTTETRALFRGANVLVHECYTGSRDATGHARADQLLGMAAELGVFTLCLLHVSRAEKELVADLVGAHTGPPRVLLPRPGERLTW